MHSNLHSVAQYRPFLQDAVYDYLHECAVSLEDGQPFASAIWGAVFLEAFLTNLLESLHISIPPQTELQDLIQRLRQYMKNPPASSLTIPDEILKRCDDIRNTRNRLVHNTGVPKKTIREDAQFIYAGIQVILEWYQRTHHAKPKESLDAVVSPSLGCRIFISANTPDNARQSHFLDSVCTRLQSLGLEPVRLQTNQFDQRDPIGRIKDLISSCQGMVVIGMERTHSYFLRDKEGTGNQQEEVHRKYPSSWLHLEAGIANALGLNIFILCQSDLWSDGIFDRKWNSYVVTEIPSIEDDSEALRLFFEEIQRWAANQQPRL